MLHSFLINLFEPASLGLIQKWGRQAGQLPPGVSSFLRVLPPSNYILFWRWSMTPLKSRSEARGQPTFLFVCKAWRPFSQSHPASPGPVAGFSGPHHQVRRWWVIWLLPKEWEKEVVSLPLGLKFYARAEIHLSSHPGPLSMASRPLPTPFFPSNASPQPWASAELVGRGAAARPTPCSAPGQEDGAEVTFLSEQ